MTEEASEHEFDIAVSFAGENRAYVEEIVHGVKAAGYKVFYDDDHVADMWGQDGVEYLNKVYLKRARYVVMFASRHYAEKMWTRIERRSSLARAATERSAYILPVRLDDTELDGLLPTTIYVEANRLGTDGLIDLIKTKLAGSSPVAPTAAVLDDRVPRTQEGIEALIAERPVGWEFRLYAAILNAGIGALEDKYRDHAMEFAPRNTQYVLTEELPAFGSAAVDQVMSIIANVAVVLEPRVLEAAFGAPGEEGDVDRILHTGQRFVSVYEDFMDWAANLRGTSVRGEHGRAATRLLAQAANLPIETMRDFVADFVDQADTIVERHARDEKVYVKLTLTLDVDMDVLDQYLNELKLAVEED